MRVRVALAAFVLALVLAALYLGTSARRGRGTRLDEAPARSAHAGGAELVPAPIALDREAAPLREGGLTPSPSLAPVAATPAAQAEEERHRLRGVLVHSSDGRPAAGAALVFHYGEEYSEAVTDADGRFQTDRLVPRGAVRVWHRGKAPDPVAAEHLEIEPGTFLLPEAGLGGEPGEVRLVLVDPAAWLEVEVVAASGVPTQAELRWIFRPPEGAGLSWGSGRSPTDGKGRARLPFASVAPGARMLLVAVLRQDVVWPVREHVALVSERVTVETPLPEEPVRLVLDTGGTIRARAVDANGEPLKGEEIVLEDRALRLSDDTKTTDAAGIATFTAVAPGSYQISYWHDPTSDWVGEEVTVERGSTVEVELRAPSLPLAVAGRVVDANDLPVEGVRFVVGVGDSSTTTITDEQGAFSVGSAQRGPVHVSVEPNPWTDRYAPAELDVPFGTRDVLIRELESRPTTTLTLEILERGTLARIPDAMVLGFVEPGRFDWFRARAGLVSLELKLYDDVWLAVEAMGYRRRMLRAVELARDVPAGEACRVLLESGLERWLQILDDESGEALVAARVFDGERLVATADGDGRAAIDLPAWPRELRVQAAGHVDAVWSCEDWLAELEDGIVWMVRAPEGRAASEGR